MYVGEGFFFLAEHTLLTIYLDIYKISKVYFENSSASSCMLIMGYYKLVGVDLVSFLSYYG